MFPNRPDFYSMARDVGDGYWLSTHSSNAGKLVLLKKAAGLAGIEFGTDLRVRFDK